MRLEPPLIAKDLCKAFQAGRRRVTALDAVTLELPPNGVTGLIGPDGAGKTTLMRLAAGLLIPDRGWIRCLGHDATQDALAVQAAVGYMPQRFGLYEDLTVEENLQLYADLHGLAIEERPRRYAQLAEMTGLGPFSRRLAGRLSGGMKQKLGLACTLIRTPRLLLLDEPTVGVDPVSRRELWGIVYRLVTEEAMAVLLSTAYLDEAERCDAVILLHEGQVVDQGTPSAFSRPLTGRTFLVQADPGARRAHQARLAAQPGIIDAVLEGTAVRVVTKIAAAPDCAALGTEARCTPVSPRFEDAFVARLKSHQAPTWSAPTARPSVRGDAIEVEALTKRFGDFTAVAGLSFRIHAGEIFGLLGANGAGKTTTFRMLCGLLPPSAGRLRVAGVDLRRAPALARSRIGYMSQRFALYGNLSVRQNLSFFARAYGLRGHRANTRITWAVEAFALEAMIDAESATLSLGYRQRLAMAAALLHEPDILFLDEPTSGVDPLARREFWARINALAAAGVTVLVTTHFMQEAEYCDRLAIMAAGALLTIGTPAEIKGPGARPDAPPPTMEDAFIRLIQQREAA